MEDEVAIAASDVRRRWTDAEDLRPEVRGDVVLGVHLVVQADELVTLGCDKGIELGQIGIATGRSQAVDDLQQVGIPEVLNLVLNPRVAGKPVAGGRLLVGRDA
ncbi:hypothetical protein GWQ44_25125 [Pseudomonas sp. 3MA1]|uniref:hypothetical protein n=1 Tax=Pseudomonas sp. 3MA1 TaxID=2699196 RepID=UPI0023DD988B|nr:hypothetical protein [Pseudomonas sp. 3MA1]MDF2398843.1 hypothetical protein [Pseudomonas sp. 3MA1]